MAGVLRGTAANRLKHAGSLRINVAAGGDSHAALHHRPQICDDIAEHVVGDDYIKPLRVLHEPHRSGVHVGVLAFDIGIVRLADLVKCPIPKIEGVGQNVRLAAKGQLLVLVAFLRVLKGIAQTALDTSARVHTFLNGNLVGCSLEHEAA